MIAQIDGYEQHFPTVFYFGQYLRNIVLGFFSNGNLTVPMVDLAVGEGLDILTSMNYYGFGDPLNLIFAFATEATAEYFYAVSLFLHLYFAGLFFGVYLRYKSRRNENNSVPLAPILVYVFCGFNLYFMVQAPSFLCGPMFLPLLLLGIERAMRSKKYMLLSAVVAMMWFSNFYFAFVNSVIAVLYVFLVLFDGFNKQFFAKCGKTVLAYLLGFGLSATVIVPTIIAFLGSSRTGVDAGISSLFVYPAQFYYLFILNLFSPASPMNYWSFPYIIHLGFLPIVLPSIVVLLRAKTEKKTIDKKLKVAFYLMLVFAVVPVIGKLFNLMGYVTHRWAYLIPFVLACIVAWSIPRLKNITGKQLIAVVFVNIIYSLALFLFPTLLLRVLGWFNALVVIAITSVIYCTKHKISEKVTSRLMSSGAVVLTVCFAIGTYGHAYSKPTYLEPGVFDKINSSPMLAAKSIQDDGFYRVAEPFNGGNINSLLGVNGVTSYYSITPAGIGEFYTSLGLGNSRMSFWNYGLDDRASLNTLAGVKYYIAAEDNQNTLIPYGFELAEEKTIAGETVYVYQNQSPLSIGYAFNACMSRDEFNKLSMLEKQEALLRYAVVDGEVKNTHVSSEPSSFEHIEKLETVVKVEDVALENGVYTQYDISFDASAKGEYYLCLNNATSDNTRLDPVFVTTNTGVQKNMFLRGTQNHCYFGMNDMCINLGYSNGDLSACSFYVSKSAGYTIDDIEIYCINMDFYQDCIGTLQDAQLENVEVTTNKVSGTLDAATSSVLQIAIPHNAGWRAYVDGAEVDVFQSGLKYCGVVVPAGNHTVEMVYSTPGSFVGVVVSLVSFALLVFCYWLEKKKGGNAPMFSSPFAKYAICGVGTTLLDFLIYMVLSRTGAIFMAKVVSMLIASVASFFLNKYWTFNNREKLNPGQGALFIGAQAVNIIVNSGVNWIIYSATNLKVLAFIVATVVAMLLNFVLQKTIVFRKRLQ